MLRLYKFERCFYNTNYGYLCGLFVAELEMIQQAIGKEVNFGEALGKDSSVYFDLKADDIKELLVDEATVNSLYNSVGCTNTISGHNPLEYIYNEED